MKSSGKVGELVTEQKVGLVRWASKPKSRVEVKEDDGDQGRVQRVEYTLGTSFGRLCDQRPEFDFDSSTSNKMQARWVRSTRPRDTPKCQRKAR